MTRESKKKDQKMKNFEKINSWKVNKNNKMGEKGR
jgi:hypothetical protein